MITDNPDEALLVGILVGLHKKSSNAVALKLFFCRPTRTRTWNDRTKTCCVANYTMGL